MYFKLMDIGKGSLAMMAAVVLLYGWNDLDYMGFQTKGGVYPNVGYGGTIAAYEARDNPKDEE
jgi:hypothetical protein